MASDPELESREKLDSFETCEENIEGIKSCFDQLKGEDNDRDAEFLKQAWSIFITIKEDSPQYEAALQEAKKLLRHGMELVLKGHVPGTVYSDAEDSSPRASRHRAESAFFDPRKLSTGEKETAKQFMYKVLDHRYRINGTQSLSPSIALEGINAHLYCTAQRLYQETILLLSGNEAEPLTGIPRNVHEDSWGNYAKGPKETYSYENYIIELAHRAERADTRHSKSKLPRFHCVTLDIGSYAEILYFLRGLTMWGSQLTEDVLAGFIINFANMEFNLAELWEKTDGGESCFCSFVTQERDNPEMCKDPVRSCKTAAALIRTMFHIMFNEPGQWLTASYCDSPNKRMGMAVSHAKAWLLLSMGMLRFDEVLWYESECAVYANAGMQSDDGTITLKVQQSCTRIDEKFKTSDSERASGEDDEANNTRCLQLVFGHAN